MLLGLGLARALHTTMNVSLRSNSGCPYVSSPGFKDWAMINATFGTDVTVLLEVVEVL